MQFTDKYIRNLKAKDKLYDVREGSGQGFGIRIMPTGYQSWIFLYHFEGKKKRMTLGSYPSMSLADARKLHRQALTVLVSGKDPGSLQHTAKVEARLSQTVAELIEEYIEKWAKPRKRSWQEDQRILYKDILPTWRKRKAKEITRRDVILLLDAIVERGSPIIANRTLAVIRRMFNFGIERDIIEINPCYAVKAPAKENRRDRVLTQQEIQSFWHGLRNAQMSELSKLALKLQLVTAQRKGEIVAAEWVEIDLTNGWWTIPAHKAKNNQPHRVPLSRLAISLLKEVKTISANSRWLFPSSKPDQHYGATSIDHALRKCLKQLPDEIASFTPHDLRRTAASHMTALGSLRLVVSKILNHVENSVTAIYDRHSYDSEKRAALSTWSDKLSQLIYGNQNQHH